MKCEETFFAKIGIQASDAEAHAAHNEETRKRREEEEAVAEAQAKIDAEI